MAALPLIPDPDDRPAECAAFAALAHHVLDGERPAADLDNDPHAAECPVCQAGRTGVLRMLEGLRHTTTPTPPAGFVDRATRAAVADYRRRRLLRLSARVGVGALAACLLIAVWLASPRSPLDDRGVFARWWPAGRATPNPVPAPPAPAPDQNSYATDVPKSGTLRGQLNEAGSAFVSLTRKATDDTLAPARNLFAVPPRGGPDKPAKADLPDAVIDIPEAAKAGLEPLADTARRAVNLFLRDVGGAAGTGKMKS
jgi:hypothetical protein